MGLNENQLQHIIELLQNSKELPTEYKNILFPPEKKEYELVYIDKEPKEDIIAETMAIPLQSIKTYGENNTTSWHNMLIFGDNLQAMKTLYEMKNKGSLLNPDGSCGIKLVYIDPPFATKEEFRSSEERAYRDKLIGAKFIEFLRKRLVFLRELLTDDGSILIHIDYRKGHYIKIILDEIFGENNFRNEIVVKRGTKNVQNQFETIESLASGHDMLFFYSKKPNTRFSKLTATLPNMKCGSWNNHWRGTNRPTMRFELFGKTPATGQWRWSKERTYEAVENYKEYEKNYQKDMTIDEYYLDVLSSTGKKLDFVRLNKNGTIEHYIPPRDYKILTDTWLDIPAYERNGYPTQKSEYLLNRIIENLSNKNDIVLDCFAGSGTTLAVAEKLQRRWIGIDSSKLAIYTIQKRFLNLTTQIGNKGKKLKHKPFTLYNAGLYDFSKLKRLPWNDWRFFALHLFQCRDVPHYVGGIQLDGYRGTDDVLVFNHLLQGGVVLDYGFIEDINSQIGNKLGAHFFIIAPAASVTFLEDYIDKGKTRYYILRIPYSIINELHKRDFEAITQPNDESQVNETVEAVGFDFIRLPEVICSYYIEHTKASAFAVIKIEVFKSKAMIKGASQKENLESLSMVMLDYDYDGETFAFDDVFYANTIKSKDWCIRIPLEKIGSKIMIIYMDVYGNEYKETKTLDDFTRL